MLVAVSSAATDAGSRVVTARARSVVVAIAKGERRRSIIICERLCGGWLWADGCCLR